MKEEHNIDRLFQDAFAEFEVTPPDSVKATIDQQIASKRKGGYWLFGSLAVILLLTTITWLSWPHVAEHDQSNAPAIAHEQVDGSGTEASTKQDLSSVPTAMQNQEVRSNEAPNAETTHQVSDLDQNTKNTSAVSGTKTPVSNTTKTAVSKTRQTKPAKVAKQTSSYPLYDPISVNTAGTSLPKDKSGEQGSKQSNGSTQKPSDRIPVKPLDSLVKNLGTIDVPIHGSTTTKPTGGSADSTKSVAASNSGVASTNPVAAASSSNKPQRWNIYALGGPAYGIRGSSSSVDVYNKWGYGVELGLGRQLIKDKQIYAGFDADYGKSQEQYTEKVITVDSVHVIDTILTADPQFPDSIIMTIIDTVVVVNNQQDVLTTASIQRFGFGLYGQFPIYTGNNWGLLAQTGFRYGQVRYRLDDSLASSYNLSSIQVRLGLFAYYDYRRFRFMVGLNSRLEQQLSAPNAYFDKRSRFLLAPQIGVSVKF
jgi:hypothetical protein